MGVLGFGFWVLGFGFGVLGFGVLRFTFYVLRFTFYIFGSGLLGSGVFRFWFLGFGFSITCLEGTCSLQTRFLFDHRFRWYMLPRHPHRTPADRFKKKSGF